MDELLVVNNFNNELLESKTTRESILAFEDELISREGTILGDNDITPVKHTFAEGVYIREMFIPKGIMISGKIHKHECYNIMLSGDITIASEEGIKRMRGTSSFVSCAGIKRVGYAHEDTVWINIHPNPSNTQDLVKLEEELISESYEDFERFIESKSMKTIQNTCNQ